eukprot:1205328-Amphidinium_carterae.2
MSKLRLMLLLEECGTRLESMLLVSGSMGYFLLPCVRLSSIISRLQSPALAFILCGLMGLVAIEARCGVGYYTDAGVSVWMPLPGLKQSAVRNIGLLVGLKLRVRPEKLSLIHISEPTRPRLI